MSNLELMFNNGMKSLGSINLGRQMQADKQKEAEDLRTKQLANENSATMNPLNAQFRQGEIAQQAATLPGIQGQSQSLGAKGQEDAALVTQKIAAGFSKFSTQIGEDGMKKMGTEGARASQIAQTLSQYPPALHKEVLAKAVQAYGGDPKSPVYAGLLQAPDDQVQKGLEILGKGMSLASGEYMQKAALAGQNDASQERIGAGNNQASIRVAEINAEAKKAAAQSRASVMKHMNTDQKIAALSDLRASGEASQGELDQLEMLMKQKVLERSASASGVAPTVLGQATPTENAVSSVEGILNKKPQQEAPKQFPAGYKQVGTSKGVPVLEGPDGKRFLWGK